MRKRIYKWKRAAVCGLCAAVMVGAVACGQGAGQSGSGTDGAGNGGDGQTTAGAESTGNETGKAGADGAQGGQAGAGTDKAADENGLDRKSVV